MDISQRSPLMNNCQKGPSSRQNSQIWKETCFPGSPVLNNYRYVTTLCPYGLYSQSTKVISDSMLFFKLYIWNRKDTSLESIINWYWLRKEKHKQSKIYSFSNHITSHYILKKFLELEKHTNTAVKGTKWQMRLHYSLQWEFPCGWNSSPPFTTT